LGLHLDMGAWRGGSSNSSSERHGRFSTGYWGGSKEFPDELELKRGSRPAPPSMPCIGSGSGRVGGGVWTGPRDIQGFFFGRDRRGDAEGGWFVGEFYTAWVRPPTTAELRSISRTLPGVGSRGQCPARMVCTLHGITPPPITTTSTAGKSAIQPSCGT